MNRKVAFLDMEGTLLRKAYHLDNSKVAPSAWTLLAEFLGKDCLREEETKDKWLAGRYAGYVEWMRDTISIHQKYNLSKKTFDKIISNAQLMPGARKLIQYLKSENYITALISGGFKALADKVQVELKIDHALSGCEYFFNKVGEIEHYNLLPSDEQGKVDFMGLIVKEHNANIKECVFIGDGKNDYQLAKAVGLSIAFNAQDELKKVSNIIIDQGAGKENLIEVVNRLERFKNRSI